MFQKKKPRLAILISGRGSNMKTLLNKVKEGKLKASVELVFSDKRDAKGLNTAESFGVKTISFAPKQFDTFEEYEKKLVQTLQEAGVEWIICAGYMRILKKSMLKAFPLRIVNIHPSLLPAFPGLRPQQQAISYGVKTTGCTVHFVDEGVDSGPIILQGTVRVESDDTEDSLAGKIIAIEHELYWKGIQQVLNGFIIEGRKVIFTD